MSDHRCWPDNWAAPLCHRQAARFSFFQIDDPGKRPRPPCAEARVHADVKGHHMISGKVKFYNDQRGFGFIQPDDGQKDVFIHATALERAGILGLREGQKVKFDTQDDPRNGKPAVNAIELA
jgi:CspA family cold shock protein